MNEEPLNALTEELFSTRTRVPSGTDRNVCATDASNWPAFSITSAGPRSRRGFTLVEVTLALVILGGAIVSN